VEGEANGGQQFKGTIGLRFEQMEERSRDKERRTALQKRIDHRRFEKPKRNDHGLRGNGSPDPKPNGGGRRERVWSSIEERGNNEGHEKQRK